MKKLLLSLFTVALAASASFGQAVNLATIEAEKKSLIEALKKADDDTKKAPAKARLWLTRAQANLDVALFNKDSTLASANPEAAGKAWEYANEAIKLDTKDGKKGSVAKEVDKLIEDLRFSSAFLNMGYWNYQNKNFRAALPKMEKASELAPKDSTSAMYWGITASQLNEDAITKKAYEKYISIGGKDLAILYSLSQVYKNNKEEDNAMAIIDKAIAIYPSNKDLKGEKFNMLIAFNRIDQAITQLSQTLANDPKDAISWLNLGLLYENKVSTLNDEIRKIQDKSVKVLEIERRITAQNDQISAFQDEVKGKKAKLKIAKTPKEKVKLTNEISSLEAKLKELNDVQNSNLTEKSAASAAAGDAVANKARMDELTAKAKEIRVNLPTYYTKCLEIDPLNYDALYQMGAYYYNDAVEIKRQVNGMDMNEYKKTGKDLEAKLAVKYNEALPYFERGFKVKKDDDLKEILKQVYRELKDEAKLAELEK